MVESRRSFVRCVTGIAPVPRNVVRARQLVQITAYREPVVLGLDSQLMALHEAVDADSTSENVFDVVRDDLAAVEVIAQVVRRLGEVHHQLVDAVVFSQAVNPAATEGPIQTVAKSIGVLLRSCQQSPDLLVVDPGHRIP